MSSYLRGRQAVTSFIGTKSSTRIVRTGVPQGSKLSPSMFNYYIADMTRPTPPVKRVCYADTITVWATGPNIPQLESMINSYLRYVSINLKDNSLLISAPKFHMHPSLSFHTHCNYVSDRIDKRNNMLKALAGSSWGQDKETLLLTYNVLGKSIASYAAPVWSTNASDSSFKKIQIAQNTTLRTTTGTYKIVLKKRPPPISDEEQRLNRRQRCTLSQLRSGHCYLLQDYKRHLYRLWNFTTRCETSVRLHHTPN